MKKYKVLILSGTVVIAAVIYFLIDYHQPRHIEANYSSTIYSKESKFEKQMVVRISGNLYKSLFEKDMLIGQMTVNNNLKYEIKLKRDGNKYFEILTKIDNESLISIGSIMTSINLDKVWLQLNDINDRYNLIDGYVSGPAKNTEEANNVARSIIEGSE